MNKQSKIKIAKNPLVSNKALRYLLQTIALLFIFTYFTTVKSQASEIAIGVNPPLIKMKTPPGTEVKQKITISNNATSPTMISTEFKKFTPSGEKDGTIQYIPLSLDYKNFLSDHVKLLDGSVSVNDILLAPLQQKTLTLDITIPKEASSTEYYLSALFITKNTDSTKSNASFITGGVSTNILISVLNKPQEDFGEITNVSTPQLPNQNPLPVTVELANQGDYYTTAQGTLTITNLFSLSKDIITLHPVDIAAHSSRYMINQSGESLTKVLWKHGFLFGIYQVDAAIKLKDNPNVFHKKIYFYSYPTIGFAVILIFIIFISILTFKIRKKRA